MRIACQVALAVRMLRGTQGCLHGSGGFGELAYLHACICSICFVNVIRGA